VEARRPLVRDRIPEERDVIGAVFWKLLEAWLLCAGVQLVLWLVAQRTKNAGIVDIGWAACFTPIVGVFAFTAEAPRSSFVPIGLVVVAWSTRLAGYLVMRGAATGAEEGRYHDLRSRWGLAASRRFFGFFQAQAALATLLTTAFVIPFVAAPSSGGGATALRIIGAIVAMGGVIGETVADAQLARWKREPANRGRVCDAGLWGWSRHPNYFFEWCVWIGYAIYGLAFAPWGVLALLGQAVIFGSIWGVTGIPPTEAQSLRSKGAKYRAYQERVSKFVPLPPKKRGAMTQTR
jgi:steroid 5-alpha reductase family enzyme